MWIENRELTGWSKRESSSGGILNNLLRSQQTTGITNQYVGLTEDPNNIPTIIVPFLHVNSGNTYRMSVEVDVLLVFPDVCFPSRSPQQLLSLWARTRADWVTTLLTETRTPEAGVVGRLQYLPISLSICLSVCLSIYLWLCSPCIGHLPLLQFLNSIYVQSVGLLGQGISQSQGRYLHTEQNKHRINAHRHPCLEWDSNQRSQCSSERRQFMP
jgi:hypothetical protein